MQVTCMPQKGDIEAVLRERSGDLPDECLQAMDLLLKMSEEALSHDELALFGKHLNQCDACATVFSMLHEMRMSSGTENGTPAEDNQPNMAR